MPAGRKDPAACVGSQSEIETRMGKSAEGNSIKVRRAAAEAGRRYAKILVESADGILADQSDGRIPVFP